MRITETIETSAGPVTVRELTVGEIRQWLAGLATRSAEQRIDVVCELLLADVSLGELMLFIAGAVDFDSLTQSEIGAIRVAAARLNPDFFRLRERLFQAGTAAALVTVPAAPSTN